MDDLKSVIEAAWARRAEISPGDAETRVKSAVGETIDLLDRGALRVAEKKAGAWTTNEWAKKAVLLSFRLEDNRVIRDGESLYYDKVPSKFAGYTEETFSRSGFRVVPPAAVRKGSYIAKNVVLMPSFVNSGAYVDEGTMVDTWATVGSCAQIGRNGNLS